MSNKIRALGNSSTSLTLETIFDSSALVISVEILSLLLKYSSDEIIPSSSKCSIFLGLTFVEIKKILYKNAFDF